MPQKPTQSSTAINSDIMAVSNSLLKVIDNIPIGPYSDSSNSLTEFVLPFTFFDAYWFKIPPVERVFFYQLTESTQEFFYTVVLPKLNQSLSMALHHYLPLSGNVKWRPADPKPIILYTPNDTVSVKIAESTADFNRLSSHEEIFVATELRPYVSELAVSSREVSIISLQITLFPGHGFCIGITTHHGVLDGQTTTMFMRSWAYLCSKLQNPNLFSLLPLPIELTPSFDRSVIINDPDGFDIEVVNTWQNIIGGDSDPQNQTLYFLPNFRDGDINELVRATFILSREDIEKLKAKTKRAKDIVHVSSFVVVCAYMSTCMFKAQRDDKTKTETETKTKSVYFGFAIDYRTRLDPPVSLNYFGNCVTVLCSDANSDEFFSREKEYGFVVAAKKISDSILGSNKKTAQEYIQETLKLITSIEPGSDVFSVAGSNRFRLYESDFGWGKPKKIDVVSIDKTGAISLGESRDENGGVEVGLCLNKLQMDIFVSLFLNGLKDI